MGEDVFHRGHALAARAGGHGIAGDREVSESDVFPGELALENRFHPAIVLHAVGEGVADEADGVILLERELRGGWQDGCEQQEFMEKFHWVFRLAGSCEALPERLITAISFE